MCIVSFFLNKHIFRPLKLEIALAIPALNDEKWQTIQHIHVCIMYPW